MPILYAGLDVSLELTSICVITAEGSICQSAWKPDPLSAPNVDPCLGH